MKIDIKSVGCACAVFFALCVVLYFIGFRKPRELFEDGGVRGACTSVDPIQDALDAKNTVVVAVHASWCGWSKKMYPEWNRFYDVCNGTVVNGKKLHLFSIEESQEEAMKEFHARFYKVDGFPSVFKLTCDESGEVQVSPHDGERTIAGFQELVN